ncbi:MAG: hypothetical protein VX438_05985, partial [Planctomycetota bacterium]|nr:hypothetical protein [Planctomycetota bacterium]
RLTKSLELTVDDNFFPVYTAVGENKIYDGDEKATLTQASISLLHADLPSGTITVGGTENIAVTQAMTQADLQTEIDKINLPGFQLTAESQGPNAVDWRIRITDINLGDDNRCRIQGKTHQPSTPLMMLASWQHGTLQGSTRSGAKEFNMQIRTIPDISGATNHELQFPEHGDVIKPVTLDSTNDSSIADSTASVKQAIFEATGKPKNEIDVDYANSTWSITYTSGVIPALVHFHTAFGETEGHKLNYGQVDVDDLRDSTRLRLPKFLQFRNNLRLDAGTLDLADGELTAKKFADAAGGIDENEISVSYDSDYPGWVIDFQGENAPSVTAEFDSPADDSRQTWILRKPPLDFARQEIHIPLGYDEISIAYNGESSKVSLANLKLTGNEAETDFPIERTATDSDLIALFAGIAGLSGASFNATVDHDTEDYLQVKIVLADGQSEYFPIEIRPVFAVASNLTTVTSRDAENSFVIPKQDDETLVKIGLSPTATGDSLFEFTTPISVEDLDRDFATFVRNN